jgi:hypothetical protein
MGIYDIEQWDNNIEQLEGKIGSKVDVEHNKMYLRHNAAIHPICTNSIMFPAVEPREGIAKGPRGRKGCIQFVSYYLAMERESVKHHS